MAVNTRSWILYEYENGKATINYKPKKLEPVEEYIRIQGRFKRLKPDQIEAVRGEVKSRYEEFVRKNTWEFLTPGHTDKENDFRAEVRAARG
jgi:pyruvate ferredoxin oxidoreductase beta subunit